MICLDTNTIIAAINAPTSRARARINAAVESGVPVAISVIVVFEMRFGIAKSARRDYNSRRLDDFLGGPFDVLPFDTEDAAEAGDIRSTLEKAGTPIGPYDLLIAAQARRRGALLVSANGKEFSRVPGLRSEDWSLPV